ncbi:hypothetical protein ACWDWO_11785 [Actinopolymorpha singaporensis]|uniref:hypothetical protein n=1 Tax=Actinopolymorpha singaporensis TaxID=117157 RepID=UPI000B87200A|nr:hypothetical protein [Actinopolymorpha singaporensis]
MHELGWQPAGVGLFVPGRRDDTLVTEVRQVVTRLDGLRDPVVRRCSPMTSLALLDADPIEVVVDGSVLERPYTDEKAAFVLGDRLRELLVALAVTLRPLYASVVLEAPFLSPKDLLVTPEPDLFLDAWFDLTRLHAGIAQAYQGAHVEQVNGGLYVSTRAPFNPDRFDEPLATSLDRARRAMSQVVAHG